MTLGKQANKTPSEQVGEASVRLSSGSARWAHTQPPGVSSLAPYAERNHAEGTDHAPCNALGIFDCS